MVHEVPDQKAFLLEVYGLMEPGSRYLIVEPVFEVSQTAFDQMLVDARAAGAAGFLVEKQSRHLISRSSVLVKR